MKDTPDHVQDIHLKIWLSKSPSERLLQALKNNEELFLFFKEGKKAMDKLSKMPNLTAQDKSSPKTFC